MFDGSHILHSLPSANLVELFKIVSHVLILYVLPLSLLRLTTAICMKHIFSLYFTPLRNQSRNQNPSTDSVFKALNSKFGFSLPKLLRVIQGGSNLF